MNELPLPPLKYRRLVGPTQPEMFENATGRPVLPPAPRHDKVLDFGCGHDHLARQMIQQRPRALTLPRSRSS